MKRKYKDARKPQISAIDLFCGVGGLTHGLMRGGISVAAGVDIDPTCRFPYEKNNGALFLENDISLISPSTIQEQFGKGCVTLLAGCAPCQPFSTYSRSGRKKTRDREWELVGAFGRVVREVKPDLVTMENVPALCHHPVFEEFNQCLDGYHVVWKVIECSEIGVPQTRKRLVLLASKFGKKGLSSAWRRLSKQTVRKTIGRLPKLSAGEGDPADRLHLACRLSELNLKRIRASRPGGTWRDWDANLRASCHKRQSGDTYPSVYGRMEWDEPAPTITTQCFGYGNGRFGHPEQDRAITLREAAMLQTFPRSYEFLSETEKVRFNHLGRLIGNAVPVKLGERIGRAFCKHVIESR